MLVKKQGLVMTELVKKKKFLSEVSGRRLNTAFLQFHNEHHNSHVPCSYSETPLLGEVRKQRCD